MGTNEATDSAAEHTTESILGRLEAAERLREDGLALVAAAHAERVACVRLLRRRMSAVQVAQLLGVTRQQVYRLERGD